MLTMLLHRFDHLLQPHPERALALAQRERGDLFGDWNEDLLPRELDRHRGAHAAAPDAVAVIHPRCGAAAVHDDAVGVRHAA